jgi:PhnB protein
MKLAALPQPAQVAAVISNGAKTFWAQRFGMRVDRFGIAWMVNCE